MDPLSELSVHAPASETALRRKAVAHAQAAAQILETLGIDVRIVGSLADGDFRAGSDIDFLVLRCPHHLKYAIEGRIEDCLDGQAFDVLYAEEFPARWRAKALAQAVHVSALR